MSRSHCLHRAGTVPAGVARRVVSVLAVAGALLAAGCGDSGAGAGGSGAGIGQTVPGTGTNAGALAVTVSGAFPVSGNGELTGRPASVTTVGGTRRQVTADAAGGGLLHRIVVEYDAVSGTVFGVTHGWGTVTGVFDAVTQCFATVTVAGQQACAGVVVDPTRGTVTFGATLMRGAGSFASILSGRIPFTLP